MGIQASPEPDTRRPLARGQRNDSLGFARQVLIAVGVVLAFGLLIALIWYAADLLMLLFAGVLVSILLRRLTTLVCRVTGLGHSLSLTIVVLVVAGGIVVFGWLVADRVDAQWADLMNQLRTAFDTVRARLENYPWAEDLLNRLPSPGELVVNRDGLLSHLPGLASTAIGAVAGAAVVIVIGIYVASQPSLYSGGIERLLPVHARPRAAEVLAALDTALGRWLVGRFGLMIINGGLTAVALWLLGVPMALLLGCIAGLLNFIPNFGRPLQRNYCLASPSDSSAFSSRRRSRLPS